MQRHLQVLEENSDEIVKVYRTLARRTVVLALQSGRVGRSQAVLLKD